MGYKKNMGRVLAGILAVGMLVSSMPSVVYAVEDGTSTAVVEEQEIVVPEETGTEAGAENVERVSAGKEGMEDGQESAGTELGGREEIESGQESEMTGASGNEEAEVGKETAGLTDTMPKEEENKGEQEETEADSEQTEENDEARDASEMEMAEERTDVSTVAAEVLEAGRAVMSGSCGQNVTWRLEEDGTLVISGSGEMEDYHYYYNNGAIVSDAPWDENSAYIKRVVMEEGVITIGAAAFCNCGNLTSIIIPEGVTTIGEYAFYECHNLTSIIIPKGVTTIGGYAFYNCHNLTSITIPEGVRTIKEYVFRGCSSLTSITIPERVTTIGEYAFFSCISLTSIIIPEGVTTIGKSVFGYCRNLASITIPEGVTTIGEYTFEDCSSLASITIPERVTTIGCGAFWGCSSLISVTIPEGVTVIEDSTFCNCSSLVSITIPKGVTEIRGSVFSCCDSLASIIIPEGVTRIWPGTFTFCESLTSITIPEGVTEIGAAAFSGCDNLASIVIPKSVTKIEKEAFAVVGLKDVYYGGSKSDWASIQIGTYNFWGTIHYNSTGSGTGTGSEPGETISGILRSGDGCEVRWECTYYIDNNGNPRNGKVVITAGYSNTVQELYLYNEASENGLPFPWELEPYNIPRSAISTLIIGGKPTTKLHIIANSFRGYSGLKEIILDYVTGIDSSAFEDCTSLHSVGFVEKSGCRTIGANAFNNCTSLTELEFPTDLEYIGKGAFQNTALGTITLETSVTEIGDGAFSGCDNLLIQCYKDSVAHQYAQKNIIPFKLISAGATVYYEGGKEEKFNHNLDHYVSVTDATTYNPQLAHMLIAMCNSVHIENDMRATFDSFGFAEDYTKLDYSMEDVLLAYGLGIKLMDDGKNVLVLVVARGTEGYGEEFWNNIVKVGTNSLGEHTGFSDAADGLYDQMLKFLETKGKSLKPDLDTKNFSDIKFVLTGHSRGAAVVNIMGKRLADLRNGEDENIYVYTFACPDAAVITDAHAAKYPTIFNIANVKDVVPWLPRTVMPASGAIDGLREDSYWNKYGYSYWFCDNWDDINRDNPGIEYHPQDKYLAYLRAEKNKSEYRTRDNAKEVVNLDWVKLCGCIQRKVDEANDLFTVKFVKILCPVDLEIYASDSRLVGRVVNNVASDVVENEIYVYIEDDRKYVGFIGEDTYLIKMTGTDTGTMEYAIQEVDTRTFGIVAEKSFKNVALTAGKRMTSRVSVWDKEDTSINFGNMIDIPDVQLLVLDDNGNAAKEVLPDGNGTEVPYTDPGEVLPEDIPTDGKIPEGLWIAAIADITYTGAAAKPNAHVYDGNVRLREGIDYTISYKNNIKAAKSADAKAPTVTVTGKGNYSGKETAAFTILPVEIGGGEVSAADFQVKTGRKALKPVPELYYLGEKLSIKRDFTVTYANTSGVYDQTGEYDVTVTGKGNYTGVRTLKLQAVETLVKPKSVSLAKASLGGFRQTFIYMGQACRQQCTLTVIMPDGSSRTLTEGTDYTVLYTDNKKAGKATVTYCGRNGYTGKLKKTYKIQQYNIQENVGGKIQYEALKPCAYAKGGSKPKPEILFDGVRMKEGADYTLSYQNNKSVGGSKTPTVTVMGKGSFTGKIQIPFTIIPQDLSNMTLVSGDKVYKNKADIYRITPKLMDLDGKLLSAGKDFDKNSITYVYEADVALENGVSKKAGDAVEKTDIIPADTRIGITLLRGSGSDYTGTYMGSYRIAKADIGSARVTIPNQIYTGQEIRPDQSQITVKLAGKALSAEDYKIVKCNNNVEKGKASVVLEGKGNYGGMKTVTFTIKAKGFLWWWRSNATAAY